MSRYRIKNKNIVLLLLSVFFILVFGLLFFHKKPSDKKITSSLVSSTTLNSVVSSEIPKEQKEHTLIENPVKNIKLELTPPAFVQPTIKKEDIKIGIHSPNVKEFLSFEKEIDGQLNIMAIDVHWGNENSFPKDIIKKLSGTGTTILIFWNPMNYNKDNSNQAEFHYQQILSGKWDNYIAKFLSEVKAYDGDIILAPFEEINGEWVPWSGYLKSYGDITEYKETFQYLYKKFEFINNVSFAWVINETSVPDVPENQIEKYYPGDDYVDIVGINGFNFGDPWISFDDIFDAPIQKVRVYNKPIYITSFASAEGAKKPAWIESIFNSSIIENGLISGWVWFNENKEKDWRVSSDDLSFKIFRENMR